MYRQNWTVHAAWALLPGGWRRDVTINIAGGRIRSVEAGASDGTSQPPAQRVEVLVPAPANAHSHSFQIAFAGRTEFRVAGRDDFWTWREQMYRWALAASPEELQALAAWAFCRMLESGYGAVGEFHYLHNDTAGRPYADPAELSRRIRCAAEEVGIGLTHLPVLYNRGGIERDPAHNQRRFVLSLERYLELIEVLARDAPAADHGLGVAPHSLRALSHEELALLLRHLETGRSTLPIHLHIAEQVGEVEQVELAYGARPVRWLLDRFGVDERWCLVHGTHLDDGECRDLARSGATVCLCPVTEANLGDGIFPAERFLAAGGHCAVGTDSNVRIGLAEELRTLEYGQRLLYRRRNVLAPTGGGSVARHLLERVALGAARALARDCGTIAENQWADLVALGNDVSHSLDAEVDRAAMDHSEHPLDGLLDRWVFAEPPGAVRSVWSAGRLVVEDGRHPRHGPLKAAAQAAIQAILSRL